jgi:hypothetical protein
MSMDYAGKTTAYTHTESDLARIILAINRALEGIRPREAALPPTRRRERGERDAG